MTFYQLRQYLGYQWKARGRHGTHSPFVYAFVEDLLQPSGNDAALLNNLPAYFGFKAVSEYTMTPQGMVENKHVSTNGTLQKHTTLPFNRLHIITVPPLPGKPLPDKLLSDMQPDDVLLIKPLHTTQQHTEMWQLLKADDRVCMSMDLFGMGLLFFKKEFKVKQDFVLKY